MRTPSAFALFSLSLVLLLLPRTVTCFQASLSFGTVVGAGGGKIRRECKSSCLCAAAAATAAPPSTTTAVLVVGGTSGVGQLVAEKLVASGTATVAVTSRSKARGQEIFAAAFASAPDAIRVVELDLLDSDTTKLRAAMAGVDAVVISVGTTAFPTIKWKGGNTPKAIDEEAVRRVAAVASVPGSTVQKVVLVTSVGVHRTKEMPFLILNLFGVLHAKRAGEVAVREAVNNYVIVRPGRLVGGPFTNLDVARLLQVQGGAENGVDTAPGDALLGDCKRDALAECIVQCLRNPAAKNIDFSIVSNDEPALSDDEWTRVFQNLQK
jgi:uncharacterized protein YbjT (DUF2867 family)